MDTQALLVGILALVIGLAFTFFGYRLFLILLPIWGFLVGFFFGANLAVTFLGAAYLNDVTSWAVAILVGLLFAVLSYLYYWAAVVLLAAGIGYGLGVGLTHWLNVGNATVAFIVGIVVAVLFAVAAVWLRLPRFLAIWMTAFGGAFAAVSGVALLLGRLPLSALESGTFGAYALDNLSWLWLVAAVVLAIVGAIYQTMTTSEVEGVAYTRYRNPGRTHLV